MNFYLFYRNLFLILCIFYFRDEIAAKDEKIEQASEYVTFQTKQIDDLKSEVAQLKAQGVYVCIYLCVCMCVSVSVHVCVYVVTSIQLLLS